MQIKIWLHYLLSAPLMVNTSAVDATTSNGFLDPGNIQVTENLWQNRRANIKPDEVALII